MFRFTIAQLQSGSTQTPKGFGHSKWYLAYLSHLMYVSMPKIGKTLMSKFF